MTDAPKLCSIHGRFQPFHNGHVNYARAALEQCEFLYVGITQVERAAMKEFDVAPHRSQIESNPFSFFERKRLIEAGLISEGISIDRFSIIPFPIERGSALAEYYPVGAICYTTIHSEWNRTKIELLAGFGYEVEVLEDPDKWPGRREFATRIRELIRARNDEWKELVPNGVSTLIERDYMHKF